MIRDYFTVTTKKNDLSKSLYQKALNTAIRLLARRDHSTYELTRKLKQRGFHQDTIAGVLSECERFDYLNDERTVKGLIRQLKHKGFGIKHIRLELNKKGLMGPYIEGILTKSVSEADERECAERILLKHIRKFDRERDNLKRRNKIYRFLYSRGFAEGIILELIHKLG